MLLKSSNRLASRLPDSTYFVRHAPGAMYSRQPGTTQSSTTCHHRNADRRRHMEQAKGARGAEGDAPGALPKGARRKQEQKPRRRIRNELVPVSFVLLRPRARPEISASNLTRHLLKIKPLLGFGSIYQGGREAGMDHGLRGPPCCARQNKANPKSVMLQSSSSDERPKMAPAVLCAACG